MSEDTANYLPNHVGIIMDGNGRWAKERRMPRTSGHKEGLNTAKKIVKFASDTGIKFITLYTFSTENWKRAEEEVSFLMGLIGNHLKKEMKFYINNGIRVVHSGNVLGLPDTIQKELDDVMNKTRNFTGITVNLAINYGGRDEVIRSIHRYIKDNPIEDISEDSIRKYLDQPDIPDPDLIIRTAGEYRLSNFLLWQCAYTELYVSDKFWPDWNENDFKQALHEYQQRERKFGGNS